MFLFVLTCLPIIIFGYYLWVYQYWRRKNLPYLPPQIPFGNFNILKPKEHISISLRKIYGEMKKRNWKHGGIFQITSPVYVAIDLDYVKNIITKDFQYFTDRGLYFNEKDDPLSAHLFMLGGPKWRNLRMKLTPTFTSGKMKMMFQTLLDCEENLQEKMLVEFEKKEPIDIKEILACFSTNIIGSCAFGLDCKTFEKENSPFRIYGKKVFNLSQYRAAKRLFGAAFPDLAKNFGMVINTKDIIKFFMNIVKETVDFREKNNVTRRDFLQLLIDIKNNNSDDDEHKKDGKSLTIEEIAAQCFVFFNAGFETSSTTMTFALYELAKNQNIQNKVRTEISTVLEKYNGQITYEALKDMKYMSQIIDETLRKYPPVPLLTRQCVKDYKIPDQDVIIEKGTNVFLPVLGLHYDEEYYPDPEKFDPERFSEENKKSRHQYAHIPFGEGPRICIAKRFGLMQTKVGLTSLLKKYKFFVNKKTQEPLSMKINALVLSAAEDIWLDAEKI